MPSSRCLVVISDVLLIGRSRSIGTKRHPRRVFHGIRPRSRELDNSRIAPATNLARNGDPMRKIVIAKVLVLSIFSLYLAVGMSRASKTEGEGAHNGSSTIQGANRALRH